jgi:hypothetical protein
LLAKRIAALILAHHRPDLLNNLIERLSGDLWQVYLHIDKKSNRSNFQCLPPKVAPESIFRVHWCGFGMVLATLHLRTSAICRGDLVDAF